MSHSSAAITPAQEVDVATTEIEWRWGLLAASLLALLSVYPQFHLWFNRGEYSQSVVAYNQGLGDEVAYAAYVKALIDGRPRRNDPRIDAGLQLR